jgi:Zn-dependent peptidase ImmA (M78 family)/DNA-binding XRE family transcriptional regulator
MWIKRLLNILVNDIFIADLQTGFKTPAWSMKGNINTNMIILAREARSMNQQELAEKINMSPTNLSKIERGDIGISEQILETIAGITGFPPHFFQQGGEIIPEHLAYRRRRKVAQKLILPINAKANIIRQHIQFLTRALQLDVPSLPLLEIKETRGSSAVARKLRRKWGIGPGPVNNLTKIMEARGLAVVHFDFGTERVDSRSLLTDDNFPVIFLNKKLLGDRQRFSLAYELGQLVMHTFAQVPLQRDIAHEANLFAAEFLLPEKEIREDFKNGVSIALLGELKKKWKVSMIALLYRADDLGIVTPNQKRYLLQQFNQLQLRRREPIELDIPAEEPALVKKWIAGYRSKNRLGVLEIAALLCLNADEFLELYS